MVIVVIGILAVIFYLPSDHGPQRAYRVACINNVKQIGLAFRVWEGDHNDKYPMELSETNGGTMEFTCGPNEYRHFQVMSNELSTPKVLICPIDKERSVAMNFDHLSNSNLSFFVQIAVNDSNPNMILAGDRNITNGSPIQNGVLKLTTNDLAGWTKALHNNCGNVAFADGSVQEVDAAGLRKLIAGTGIETNLVQMPVLGP